MKFSSSITIYLPLQYCFSPSAHQSISFLSIQLYERWGGGGKKPHGRENNTGNKIEEREIDDVEQGRNERMISEVPRAKFDRVLSFSDFPFYFNYLFVVCRYLEEEFGHNLVSTSITLFVR